MALSGTSDLYIVELTLYLFIAPFVFYLALKHGSAGVLGYFYLSAACAVRIAVDIVSLLPANRDATHPNMALAILASIGLSPLLLALGGFLHEVHLHLLEKTSAAGNMKKTRRWLMMAQLQIHGISILGMALAITGNIKLLSSNSPLSVTEISTDEQLRSSGSAILLALWLCLALYALCLLYLARRHPAGSDRTINLQNIARWIILAMPFAGLRCMSSVLYAFDHKDSKLNPSTGALWVKVVLVVLASLGVVICLSISGWLSRDFQRVRSLRHQQVAEEIQYHDVQLSPKH